MRAKKTRVGSVDEKREREGGRENCGGLSRDLNGSESEIQQRRRVENKGQRNVNTITLAIGSTGLGLGRVWVGGWNRHRRIEFITKSHPLSQFPFASALPRALHSFSFFSVPADRSSRYSNHTPPPVCAATGGTGDDTQKEENQI